jgi:hypothetical protein
VTGIGLGRMSYKALCCNGVRSSIVQGLCKL